jgi:hypothetical protein
MMLPNLLGLLIIYGNSMEFLLTNQFFSTESGSWPLLHSQTERNLRYVRKPVGFKYGPGHEDTVDGRNPASPWMVETLQIMG